MMHKLPVLVVLLGGFIESLNAEAFFSVKFLTFRNARGLNDRGRCCDDVGSTTCKSPCDHSFTICLDQIDGSKTDISSCTYGKQISSEIQDANTINFQDRIANLANPIIWRMSIWPGRVLLKIDVVDVDHLRAPDHVAYLSMVISLQPVSGNHGARFKVGRNVELMFEARTYCGRNSYGHNCSVSCLARDDSRGHYSCHRTNGSKVCMTGTGVPDKCWAGEKCLVKKSECSGVVCLNGGTCQDLLNLFECRCAAGYEGRFCEAEINECLNSDVCRHGDCVNTPGSFTCTCFQGFTGASCDTNIDDCAGSPCQNGALCIDRIADFECSCLAGYTGKMCGTDIDECRMEACKHNSTCINIIGDYSCDCLHGYQGNDCSLDVNECDGSNPCLNQGICINLLGTYACQCPVGLQGVHCETDIDECQDVHVCRHGGACVNTHSSFTCVCTSEYFGPRCEHDVDECIHSPCQHGGQCDNVPGGFFCHCPDRFTGKLCDEAVNECSRDVCKNGGNCTDLDDGFLCTCSQFWAGVRCEQNVNECLSDPCKHGGSCQNLDDGFMCVCQAGFHGRLCEKNAKKCDLVVCENMSLCAQNKDAFLCLCPKGWTGQSCLEDTDECKNEICKNNSTCLNTEGGFKCQCSVNWTGQRCELDVNRCEMLTNPCKNGATCLSVPEGFICECPHGWTGPLCNEDINECIQDPDICQTLASSEMFFSNRPINKTDMHIVCQNTSPGYRCVCDPGWTGLLCSEDVDECKVNPYICSFGRNFLKHPATDTSAFSRLRVVCLNMSPGYACVCDDDWTGHNCETQIHNLNLVSDIPSSTNVDFSKTMMGSGSKDAQLPGCDSADCLLPGDANQINAQSSTEQVAWNRRTMLWDFNSSISPQDANATGYFTGNHSDPVLPFYLDCEIGLERRVAVDKGLEQFFWDTHSFLGKRLSVGHRSQVWTSKYGKVVTAIIPVVEVDGRTLSDSEVSDMIISASHKFHDYIQCASGDAASSDTPSWFPGFISVCVLAVVIAGSVALFTFLRRIRKEKKQTFNISPRKISLSFRNETYKTRPRDSLPKHEHNSPVVMRVFNDQMSISSLVNMLEGGDNPDGCPLPAKNKTLARAIEDVPEELPCISEDRRKENANQDQGLQAALRNTVSIAAGKDRRLSQRVSSVEYSTPVVRYINVPNVNNNDTGESVPRVYRYSKQPPSGGSTARDPYVKMLQNKEMNAEVYTSSKTRECQPMNAEVYTSGKTREYQPMNAEVYTSSKTRECQPMKAEVYTAGKTRECQPMKAEVYTAGKTRECQPMKTEVYTEDKTREYQPMKTEVYTADKTRECQPMNAEFYTSGKTREYQPMNAEVYTSGKTRECQPMKAEVYTSGKTRECQPTKAEVYTSGKTSECQPMKAEVHPAGKTRECQPMKAMAFRKMAQDMERDKYRGLPYIDDPGYTEIITKEEQDVPSDNQYLK